MKYSKVLLALTVAVGFVCSPVAQAAHGAKSAKAHAAKPHAAKSAAKKHHHHKVKKAAKPAATATVVDIVK